MLPMLALRLRLGALLAADTTTLAPVAANKIALIVAAFTPDENLTLAALTLASFTGSAPLAGAAGPQGVGIDPATLQQIVTILAPAGGWRWVCTVAPSPAQVVFGYALVDGAVATLLGVHLLDAPLTIQAVNDVVDLGAVPITFVLQPMS